MAHSCRWRFPARPGTTGGGGGGGRRGLGAPRGNASASSGPALLRVGPGFDAALQVSAAIGTNLRRFRAVFGESGGGGGSGEDEQFLGFGSDEEVRVRSPTRSPSVKTSPRKPRGRPRSGSDRNSAILSDPSVFSPLNKSETKSGDKIKKKDSKSIEKKRGRPPTFPGVKIKITHGKDISELPKGSKEDSLKKIKRTPSATFQQATKIKKLRAGKLSPLKSKFKTGKLQIGRKGVQIVRRRGRPPSTERIKTPSGLLINSELEKPQKVRKDKEGTPPLTKEDKTVVRQSPRRIKPVRIIPSSKRTDATIAKQLLQRAKKGAQKKIEKEAAQLQGRKVKTQVKNIRQFIMPVVSAISSRIIKTPRRFIEDEDYDPPIKIARLESTPNSRFSATSCGSSEKSSAASQHSSQMSSDSSRSSSPSVDTSTDSQASEEIQVLPEERSETPEVPTPLPISQSPENDSNDRRSRRYSVSERSFGSRTTKKLSTLQSAPQQQPSSSPPPPLLTPPPPLQPASSISDHTPWLMPPTIPLASPFLPASAAPMQGKRKSILREPTFRWTSLKHSRSEPQYFSSAKYAKEGLIRKPIFDNFRPPPLTPEDVGFASGFSTSGTAASARLFSPLHSGTRFDMHKRSPLLRAPRFTPSEAHSRIFESVTLPSNRTSAGTSSSGVSNRKRKRKVFSPIRSEPRSPSHSMRTRSGRLSTAELSPLTPPSSVSSSLSISVSPLATSALNPTFTFPSHSLTQAGESAEKSQRPRKQASAPAEPFSSGSPTPLFPWFTPGSQTERGRNKDKAPEELSKDRDADKSVEKDKSRERDREREKENKRESRKEKRKKGSEIQSSSALYPVGRVSKDKVVGEDVATSSSAKKATGRKKSSSLDSGTDIASVTLGDTTAVKTKILIKKGRGNLEKNNLDLGPTAPSLEKEKTLCLSTPSSSTVKHSTSSIGSMLAQADKLPMTDKRVASLLKKAKAQLCKIEKSKSLKQTDQPKAQVLFPILPVKLYVVYRALKRSLILGREINTCFNGFSSKCSLLYGIPCYPRMRKCQNLQWMPSKAYLQKQAKGSVVKRSSPNASCSDATQSFSKQENTGTLNILSTLSNGNSSKQKIPADGVHRIRVDFKEDCEAENVWEMGGLGILTSVPITPRVVCFLCASSGHVEFVYCQVCCEPFHKFCLEENERPLEDQLENWCCRRCKFCHVCGRQHQATKQLLECNKCRNSYHPECLGPNYPTKPTKKKKVWICTKCVRCKSCGSTTPGKGWDAQWSHDFSLCHDCAKLFAKGNFCPLCDKCYDDDDYESKMMQCGKCDRWVHSKCENLSDEMYEILSNLPESVAYTCVNCTERHPAEWRLALEKELQSSLKQVLTALLNSRTTSHLLRYRQAAKPPDLNPETEESIPSRSSPEGPDPPVLTEVSKQEDQQPLDLEGVKRKMDQGNYTSVLEFSDDIVKIIQAAINSDGGQPEIKKANSMVKSFFIRQMERVFPWFSVKKSRFWEPNKVSSNSGMLPNAVLPPSLDHNYAQWQEREENSHTEQPPLMKKIIPAPKAKGPGEPDSPTPLHPPTPPILSTDRSREDSPELNPPPGVEDNRQCALCLTYGDDSANDAGRLLYIGQNEWTHVNCALWSAEVFEDDDGSLKNVHMAVIRGKQLRCEFCQKPGATVGCCLTSCTSNYHFMCSRAKNCVFLDDKKVYCQRHRDLIKGEVVPENGFEVFRRVFVDFEGISLRRKFLNGLEPENIHMMIGSMTIDCLGILNDLSDCEDKLFPIGYQCSRVYWSTTDARKRCVYTCKIVECRPPVVEPDINKISSKESQNTAEIVSPPSPERPHSQTSGSCFYHVISKVPRIRTPSYSPTQRSPGCRPLPSAGSPTPTTHEIVTVGDPLLSSGLRSIGSRRHSTSSLSPQRSKLRIMSPMRTGGTYSRNSVSSVSTIGTATDLESSAKAVDHVLGPLNSNTNLGQNTPTSSNLQRTVVTMGAKTSHLDGSSSSDMKHSSASDLASKSSSLKGEKTKVPSSKSSEGPAHTVTYPSLPKLAPQVPNTAPVDLNASKIGTFAELSSGPFSSKEALSFPPLHLRGQRNERDQHSDSNQSVNPPPDEDAGVKTLKLSGVSNRSSIINEHVGSSSRDRRQKGKKSCKETFKEKHSSKSFLEPGQVTTGEEGNLKPEFVGEVLTPEFMGQRPCNNVSSDKIGDKVLSIPGVPKAPSMQVEGSAKELQTPRKRTVKVTLTPLKMESEGQSKNTLKEGSPVSPLQIESASPTEPVAASESPGDGPVAQPSPNNTSSQDPQSNNYQNLPVQDRNLMLPDGPKPQEDGSFKRRYPRRSARARSNMFFGLTPLYGVRSYGEEDIPFYSSSTGKKRGKRSAEGQVDGADDLSTSDEDDLYYYNFTRTVISSGGDERLASHNLFREEEQCDLPKISQLDGVDDGTESDTSVTATTRKSSQIPKRNGKENGTENLKMERPEDAGEKEHVIKGSVGHKNEPKMDNCHSVSRVKAQGQDSLEAQLSSLESSRRLLKSDSDNNNSDDCGNILPSDIMDFVLKNTPSMQALGESPESSSSELLNLGEGLGLDSNREKDMGLFEVFSQQLPTAEPVDSSVSSSISAEEQFELPLELPSDLSVLTTRSPTVPSQNPSRLAVISDSGEKRVTITEKSVASSEGDSALLSPGVDPTPEGHMTPDHFIQGHMDADHISSPPCGSVEQGHGNNQDLTRNSSTPGLQVPVSPTVPIQNQKYVPNSTESPGPSQISNAAVQTTPPHLKPATEKLIVVNQNMQPLYVLQTLPNGVTQKIQLTSSVTTGLNPSLPTSPSLFPPASKGLLPMPHHQHLHSFPAAAQSSFPPNISSPPSGLLIGVQPPPDPQLLVSEASQRTDLSSTVATPSSGLKKRPISRLQTRKNKKLAPSSTPSTIAPSDVVSNMTLINFTPSQLPNHPNLLDLGSLNTSSHRTVPNIIKRSKSGIMYFEQAPLLPQSVGSTAAAAAGTSTMSQDTGHLTAGPVSGLASGSSVLNVVSMQTTTTPTSSASVPGHVALTNPRLLGTPDIGSISNLLIKASQQSLGMQDQPVALPPSSAMFPQLGTSQAPAATMTAASSICVLPSAQTAGITAASPSGEAEEHYQLQHVNQLLASKTGILPSQRELDSAPGTQGSNFTQTVDAPSSMGLEQNKALSSAMQAGSASPGGSPSSGQQSASPSVPAPTKPKPKIKRFQLPLDKGNGKKHKVSHLRTSSSEAHIPDQEANTTPLTSVTGKCLLTQPVWPLSIFSLVEPKTVEEEESNFSSPLMLWLQQEQKRKESIAEKKPKKGLVFEISSDDGFQICAESIEDAWKSLTDKVQEARSNARLKQLSFAGVNGLRMLGILHDAVVFLIEQLSGAKHCRNYKFRFHKPEEANEPPLNPHGSARAEVHLRKSAFDMFNFLASKHRQPPEYNPNDEEEEEVQLKSARRATSMDLPMPMRFRHLKKTSKEAVGVYRSPIHGRGLFCKRNIDAGEMVIEYAGNVIRSIQTDKREKYYDSKGIGCYMFRIDDSEVVDATMHGNAARFINHSCEPNCYSRVINIDGQKHIVIFAMRKIYRGEELTYDYKFPIEDASNKLPCNCGAKKCRKFLN
uniref:Histone-lysine N-methyltransferase n=1 Tax=Ursus americanus TaxID=9643 RepID=A0A452QVS0_URSAM